MQAQILKTFSGAEDGVYAVDMKQRIVFVNPSAERLLGISAADLVGKRCYRVMGGMGEDDSRVCTRGCPAITMARQGRVGPSCRLSIRNPSGQSRWWSMTHVLLPGAGKRLAILAHIFHDTTEEVDAKRLVRVLTSALSRATRALTRPRESAPQGAPTQRSLSDREMEVLALVARGLDTAAIAAQLSLSPHTIRSHVQRIMADLGVRTRLEAVAVARHRGLVDRQS